MYCIIPDVVVDTVVVVVVVEQLSHRVPEQVDVQLHRKLVVSTAKHVAPFRQGLDEHGFAYFCQISIIDIDKRILISDFYKLNGLMKKNKSYLCN